MYQAKSDGRGRWVIFDDTLRRKAVERQRTETALRQSRHGEDLVIHYQPVVDLRTGTVRAVEALVRWNRNGESVGPDDFVPIAEETGLIVPIGSYVLRHRVPPGGRVATAAGVVGARACRSTSRPASSSIPGS